MNNISDKLLTASISIATTGIMFCCGFMWRTNEAVARIEQHEISQDKIMDDLQINLNNLQLEHRKMRDDVIELKTMINKKR